MGFLETDAKRTFDKEDLEGGALPSPGQGRDGDRERGRTRLEELRAKAEVHRAQTTAKVLRALGHLPDEDRERIEALSRELVEAFLEVPARRLEALGGEEGELFGELFGLDRPEKPGS